MYISPVALFSGGVFGYSIECKLPLVQRRMTRGK